MAKVGSPSSEHGVIASGESTHERRYRGGTQPNKKISGFDLREDFLLFDNAVQDRSRDVRIKSCIPSQLLGLYLVNLPVTLRDSPQLGDVCCDDLVSKFLKLLVDPDRSNCSE